MNKYHIPNLEKACEVMNLISNTPNGCSLKDIVATLKIPRTTALRITQTLLSSNYLAQDDNGNLTLGISLIQVGVKALDSLDIRSFARPVLKMLTEETGESSHLAVLNGNKTMLIEVIDNPYPVRIASRPGTLADLHCSSTGKVFLAYSIPDAAEFCKTLDLKSMTKNTDTTVKNVLNSIKQTRKDGYAMDEEEYVLGVRCIAFPITNAFGKTIAAVGITASTSTFRKKKIPDIAKKVKQAAFDISSSMGLAQT